MVLYFLASVFGGSSFIRKLALLVPQYLLVVGWNPFVLIELDHDT